MNVELNSNKIILSNNTAGSAPRTIYMSPGVHKARIVEFRDWNEEEREYSRNKVENARKMGITEELVPFISMTIEDESTGARFTNRFYLGSSSNKYNKAKIGHIVATLCPGCNLAEMNSTELIADGIVGKVGRFKVIGEQAISKRGTSYARAKTFPKIVTYGGEVHGFCERLDQVPSKLTFDENNSNDFKKLSSITSTPRKEVPVETPSTNGRAEPNDDDLPF